MRMGKTLIWIGLTAVITFTLLVGGRSAPIDTAVATNPPQTLTKATYASVDTLTPPPEPNTTPTRTTTATEPPAPSEPCYSDSDIKVLAKAVYGEAGICSTDEQRLVIWTVLQRMDACNYGDTISEVITAKSQFVGYHPDNPVDPDIYALCVAELANWCNGAEPPTHEVYAPTAPYYFFDGDGRHNWYREQWK